MPCYDPRPDIDAVAMRDRLDAATRAACELAELLTRVLKYRPHGREWLTLSTETRAWVSEHAALDARAPAPSA
jgi:hypothetical protein